MKITLLGAGGKIGFRLARKLAASSDHDTRLVEISDVGRSRLADAGLSVVDAETALPDSDVVILAVPDTALGTVTAKIVPELKPGAIVLALDPAAPLAGELFHRDDLVYAVAHPCHPSAFGWEPDEATFRDFYGGEPARQAAAVALIHGPDSALDAVDELARVLFSPVTRVHRLTLRQMALLEPGLAEALQQTCLEVIREGLDIVVERGVPFDAARDFLLGHLRIQSAILFGEYPGRFSDAAYRISAFARPKIFRDDWQNILTDESVEEQVQSILKPE